MTEENLNCAARVRRLSAEAAASHARSPEVSDILLGDGVRVVAIDPAAHGQALFDLSHNVTDRENLWAYLPYGPFQTAAEMTDWMTGCAASKDPLFFAFTNAANSQPFGMASFLNIHPEHGSVEIGHIWIVPSAQQTRLATEAIYLMMAHVLDRLKFRRLEWKCNALNEKSRAAAKRFGFSYEGTFFRHLIIKGKNRDTAWFSITQDEWPSIRRNFEAWLGPENFDETGQQKTSLLDLNWPK